MSGSALMQWALVVQASAVLLACGSVLLMSISFRRSIASIENSARRIDCVLDALQMQREMGE